MDLGATYNITEVKLTWEAAYATSFQIQVSSDTTNWATIYSTTTGPGGVQDLTGLSGVGRYVRMYGTVRATQYGYSLYEFEVYGNIPVGPPAPTGLTATAGNMQVALSWNASSGATNYNVKSSTTNGGPYLTIASPTTTGYTNTGLVNETAYYYVVSATAGGLESANSFQASAKPTEATTNLALHKVVTVSSFENGGTPGTNAVDGDYTTRWSSASSDPQWIYVDLQATYYITRVKLTWQTAYATSFQIQVSSDAVNWTTIYNTTTGTGGTNDLTGLSGTGRFVRMYGTVRATQYGYSLWEFEVYGDSSFRTTYANWPDGDGGQHASRIKLERFLGCDQLQRQKLDNQRRALPDHRQSDDNRLHEHRPGQRNGLLLCGFGDRWDQ